MTSKSTPREAWVPPSVDPTDLDYPLESPKLSGCLWKIAQLGMFVMAVWGAIIVFGGGNKSAGQPGAAAATTRTQTVPPTVQVQVITVTPAATALALPTSTATITPIPPGSIATWTPGPWMLTKFVATYESQFGRMEVLDATATLPVSTPTPER